MLGRLCCVCSISASSNLSGALTAGASTLRLIGVLAREALTSAVGCRPDLRLAKALRSRGGGGDLRNMNLYV